MKTYIHVNQHHIRSNKSKGTNLPVITVKQGKKNTYCNEVEILGPSKVIYGGEGDTKPLLSCGARVVIVTEKDQIIRNCVDPNVGNYILDCVQKILIEND